jgi:hypothetical protein
LDQSILLNLEAPPQTLPISPLFGRQPLIILYSFDLPRLGEQNRRLPHPAPLLRSRAIEETSNFTKSPITLYRLHHFIDSQHTFDAPRRALSIYIRIALIGAFVPKLFAIFYLSTSILDPILCGPYLTQFPSYSHLFGLVGFPRIWSTHWVPGW